MTRAEQYLGLAAMALIALAGCQRGVSPIEPFSDYLLDHIEVLTSDAFEGRAPSTPGGMRTEAYIQEQFEAIGLLPANGPSYRQTVSLVEITAGDITNLEVRGQGQPLSFAYQTDMMVWSTHPQERVALTGSEMVFVGYGIVAPEYHWNDYQGIDVRGKTVVMLVNDPGLATGDPAFFTGRAMTYYGRWTYKLDEAARQGAAAAFIIHQTHPAGYGWDVVSTSWHGPQYHLDRAPEGPHLQVRGWLHEDTARRLFEQAGVDFDAALEQAARPGFRAIPLHAEASVAFSNAVRRVQSDNIIGYVKGAERPEEAFIYMAHWDHLGMVEGEQGRQVFPGAVDNATGVAGLIEIARRFASLPAPPARSVVFMAVTAEESGLLGSRHYSNYPLFPIATTVAGINLDALNVYGPTADVTVIGYGASELDDYLRRLAAEQGRTLTPDPNAERGYYYRSDHFSLARLGVPMIFARGGPTFVGQPPGYAQRVANDWDSRYHQPSDVIHPMWNLDGMHQDLWLFYRIGLELATSSAFPSWAPGHEFRRIRDATAAQRER